MNNETTRRGAEPTGFFLPRFRKFSQEAFSPRTVGFACSRTWIYTVFSVSLLMQQDNPQALIDIIYILSLGALVALLAIGGIADKRCETLMATMPGRVLPAALSIFGTSLIPLASSTDAMGITALIGASVATGLGSGLFVLYWGRVYSVTGGPVAAAETSVAFILATLPVPLMTLLPPAMLLAVITILPVASSLILFRYCDPLLHRETADDPVDWQLEIIGLGWRRVMLKLVASSIVFGCVVSLMHKLTPLGLPNTIPTNAEITLLLSALIAGGITLAVLFFSRRLDLAFTYRPVLIFMVLGCVLFPFLDNIPAIAWTFTMSGYLCFEIMNWVTMSDLAFRFNLPPFKVFGYGRAAVSGGVWVGALIAQWLNSNVEFSFQVTAALSFAMVFVMIVSYTFTLTERDVAKLTRLRAHSPYPDALGHDEPTLEERVAIIAEEHGIGDRGLEVLQLLAKGRSGTRIEQELYISRGTVNTHMRRLYQKLGVHTRQELLDLIDAHEPTEP